MVADVAGSALGADEGAFLVIAIVCFAALAFAIFAAAVAPRARTAPDVLRVLAR